MAGNIFAVSPYVSTIFYRECFLCFFQDEEMHLENAAAVGRIYQNTDTKGNSACILYVLLRCQEMTNIQTLEFLSDNVLYARKNVGIVWKIFRLCVMHMTVFITS